MKAIGYITNNHDFIKRGKYNPTELDHQKAAADFLIEAVDGNYTTIRFNRPVGIKGRGIKPTDNASRYYVTDNALDKLKAQYSWACDF